MDTAGNAESGKFMPDAVCIPKLEFLWTREDQAMKLDFACMCGEDGDDDPAACLEWARNAFANPNLSHSQLEASKRLVVPTFLDLSEWMTTDGMSAFVLALEACPTNETGLHIVDPGFCTALSATFDEFGGQPLSASRLRLLTSLFWKGEQRKKDQEDGLLPRHILLPINRDDNHWYLAVLDLDSHTCRFYDSLPTPDVKLYESTTALLQVYLQMMGNPKTQYVTHASLSISPLQDDSVSCGPLTCLNMAAVYFGARPPFSRLTPESKILLRNAVWKSILSGRSAIFFNEKFK